MHAQKLVNTPVSTNETGDSLDEVDENRNDDEAADIIPTVMLHSLVRAAEDFLPLKQFQQEVFNRWVQLTMGLIESLPLGLPDELLKVFLVEEYGIDLTQETSMHLADAVASLCLIVHELNGFLGDDTLQVLSHRLDVSLITTLDRLSLQEHPETGDARARNALLKGQEPSPVRDVIEKWVKKADDRLRTQGIEPEPDLVRRLLLRRAVTLGGRVTDFTFSLKFASKSTCSQSTRW